jgi:urea transport system substrate-binding protein
MSSGKRIPHLSTLNRRELLAGAAAVSATAMLAPGAFAQQFPTAKVNTTGLAVTDTEVTVGILHSVTGTMAISETGSVQAEKLAIEQINAKGGVLGRKIKFIQEDGASDWPTFAEKARKLLEKDKVAAIMGCYTSASRKAVLPVFEKLKGLLYYPTYYEGLEMSPNIMYTAQEATQSVIAAMEWLYKNKGKSYYMIGSDYIWPRTTIKIAKATLTRLGGKLVGEGYYPLGHIEFSSEINKIKAAKPDVILNCVVGGSNVAFFKQLTAAGITGKNQTLLSLAVSEEEVSGIGAENTEGTLTCMGYFQSLKNPANEKFVKAFKTKYGQNRVLGVTRRDGSRVWISMNSQPLVHFGETLPYAAMASFIVLDLDANGIGHGATAFTALAVTVVLTRLVGGDLPDRIGPLRCAAGAAAIEVVGLALIAVATSLPVALAGAVGMGAAFALIYPSLSLVVVDSVPDSRRGAALGTFTAFFDIGIGIGGPLAGLAVSLAGYSAAFWLASACALGTLVVANALRRGWSAAPAVG